jgi:hypothetical protein
VPDGCGAEAASVVGDGVRITGIPSGIAIEAATIELSTRMESGIVESTTAGAAADGGVGAGGGVVC